MHSDWLILPLLLPTPTIWFSLDHKRNVSDGVVSGVGRKWKRSDSSDSDSVALMTPLTTPSFDFHLVISALTTPLTIQTPTPSLVKTSLNKDSRSRCCHLLILICQPEAHWFLKEKILLFHSMQISITNTMIVNTDAS